MTKRDKTTVGDIIGIIHTDETINSVEEVKKLRGRENRTEKRFKLKYINEQHISANLYDNETFIGSIGIGDELIVELLNNLSEENEQLKRQVKEYSMRNTVNSDLYDETYEQLEKMEKNYKSLLNENEQLKADKQRLIDFIKKEFPKSYKHILEGFE